MSDLIVAEREGPLLLLTLNRRRGLELEIGWFTLAFQSREAKAGIAAFLAKK